MNNLGGEVTIKVKEAIRTKLKEMNANSSDEIIDYIMLLVTTKKSSTELVKSIDFLMENNTPIFVKWLSTVIKKLQQVTVSTTEKKISGDKGLVISISEDLQTPKQNTIITTQKIYQNNDILICKAPDEKLEISDKEKEELKLDFTIGNENIKTFNREKGENGVGQLNGSKSIEYDEDEISPLLIKLNRPKQNICSFPKKDITTSNNIQTNKKTISIKNNCEIVMSSNTEPIKITWNGNEEINCKTKRPRISIKSDDEDDKSVRLKIPITMKETIKPITKDLPNKNKKSTSQVIVKPAKQNIHETEKKLYIHDLVGQRIDHQRGALALDTAFKYIQQQIGASDREIEVIKKWRDYAVDMLRSAKKV